MLPELCLFLCVAVMGYQPSQGHNISELHRHLSQQQYSLTFIAGNGEEAYYDAIGTNSKFIRPAAVKLYSSDQYALIGEYKRIRKIDMATMAVTTLAGNGNVGNADGVGTLAQFVAPYGLAISSDNSFAVVADFDSHYIRLLLLSPRQVATLHPDSSGGGSQDSGAASSFNSPSGIVLSADDSYALIVDRNNNRIQKLLLTNNAITTVAGGGTGGNADGIGTNAQFNNPIGMFMSSDKSFVLITEFAGNRVRKMVLSTSMVTTIAGSSSVGTVDGVGTSATFSTPSSVILSQSDTVAYVTDLGGHAIRHIDMATLQVTRVVGTTADACIEGVGTSASISTPSSLDISDDESFMLVCSMYSHRIAKVSVLPTLPVSLPTISPTISPYSAAEVTFLCDMVTFTSVGIVHPSWSCTNTDDRMAWDGLGFNDGSIISIDLSSRGLSGTLPSSIGSLTKLTALNFKSNILAGGVPDTITSLSNLSLLNFGNNSLQGTIPMGMVDMTNLIDIDLGNNRLSGVIPPLNGLMSGLTNLRLDSNMLSGGIPSTLGEIVGLYFIRLYNNLLSGPLPTELSSLMSLRILSAANNVLSGTLPSSFGVLSRMEVFQLNGNYLTGSIPLSYANLNSIRSLRLDSNNLNGDFPPGLCDITGMEVFYLTQTSHHECRIPSAPPSFAPTISPTAIPTAPSLHPSGEPSGQPSEHPSYQPSLRPTAIPTYMPTGAPSAQPTCEPSWLPTSQPSSLPSGEPSGQPTTQPSEQPTSAPSSTPSVKPSGYPTSRPSEQPTCSPSGLPSVKPSGRPTCQPSGQPTAAPSVQPSAAPSGEPTGVPSGRPTGEPTCAPSGEPTSEPTCVPSGEPTGEPSRQPTCVPSGEPTGQPTGVPSGEPSGQPTSVPSGQPSGQPTCVPSGVPTGEPSGQPTCVPSGVPTGEPSGQPTSVPSGQPSGEPSRQPTYVPSGHPTGEPTSVPSGEPTGEPSGQPSGQPTCEPTCIPSGEPTCVPSGQPSGVPSVEPTGEPTCVPSGRPSGEPTCVPSGQPTGEPSGQPTNVPSGQPTCVPSGEPTGEPSRQPTGIPSGDPTSEPSGQPSGEPTGEPTCVPSGRPSGEPTCVPSGQPTGEPSRQPTNVPSGQPTCVPSGEPTGEPSRQPTGIPSGDPTSEPSGQPSGEPTGEPTCVPSGEPSRQPTGVPSGDPTGEPTCVPSGQPTGEPSGQPSGVPSADPTAEPTCVPSGEPTGEPSGQPTSVPSGQPTGGPTCVPSGVPSYVPSSEPTCVPSGVPTGEPSGQPTFLPSVVPSGLPSHQPTTQPSSTPSSVPTSSPSLVPSCVPTVVPSENPTCVPTGHPSITPTSCPSHNPTITPTLRPTHKPTLLGDTIPPTQFPTFSPTFSPTVVPVVPPNIQTCTLSNDGSYVILVLDAASDMGGLGSQFQCSQLFDFSGSSSFVCRWKESSSRVWLHSASSILDVGDSVTMKGGILRAMCPSGASKVECSRWATASSQSCVVLPPPNPISPAVSISAPSTLGQCDDFVVDISGSSGSGGRGWYDFSVDVFSFSNSSYSLQNASDIRRFYRSVYKYTPPTPLPGSYLKANEVYAFEIRLCNFLQKCSSAIHNVAVKATSVPVATIVGQAQRNVYRRYPLGLSSHAYTASCGADKTQRGLSYLWFVEKNGTIQDDLINTNSDSSKFKLLPYSLDVGEVYTIVLNVMHDVSKISTSSSVKVSVLPSSVVAVIEGGSVQTMRYGESLVLDGSGSYDNDMYDVGGVAAGLSLSWSCTDSVDSSRAGCGLTLTPSESLDTVTVTANSESLVNTETVVTLTVSGSYDRSDVAVVTVRIAPPLSPKVSLSLSSRKVKYAEKIKVQALVEVFSLTTAEWFINDDSIDLVSSALTPVSRVVTPGSLTAFNLVLGGSTLYMGASFTFTCSVGSASSSVTVDVVGPPSPGSFVVDPTSGYELQDKFMMMASQWTDSELPLTYSFGYFSASGDLLTLHARSELTYVSSTLPAVSSSANHSVSCQVTVYNLLDANAVEFYTVTVEPVTSTPEDLSSIVVDLLMESESSIDTTKQTIAVLTGVINTANCSLAPDCASLHRYDCGSTSHSCGKCWTGYFGAEGDANSVCYSGTLNIETLGLLCGTDNDCGMYQSCTEQVCEYMLKQCPRNCTGRGICQMEDISTGNVVGLCRADDVSCRAVCVCDNGFSGDACDTSTEVLEIKQQSRWQLIDSASTTVVYSDATSDNIVSAVATVSQLSANPAELTPDACAILYDLVYFLLDSADVLELAYEEVSVYKAIDMCSSIVTNPSSRRRLTAFSNWTSSAELIDKYSDLISSQMVAGQKDVAYVQSLSRVVSAVRSLDGSGFAVTLPRTGEEEALDIQKSVVIINGSKAESVSSVAVSVIESAAKLYQNSSNFTSNPINIRITTPRSGKAFEEVMVVLRNHQPLHGSLFNITNTSFTTSCLDYDHSVHNYTCPGSNFIVSHECTGTPRVLKTTCPFFQTIPECRVIVGGVMISDSKTCEVVGFTETNTTCRCMINYAQSKRLLSSTSDNALRSSGSLEVVAIMENTYTDFVETILESDNITTAGIRDVLLVIIMFFSMWAVGLVSMLELTRVSFAHKQNKIRHKSVVGNRTTKSGLEESDTSVQKKYLLNYIRELVPSVFQSHGSSWQCLVSEVAKHHRYVVMILANGPDAEERRLQAGLHVLTVQTMLMFLIAIFYDVEYPTDDGTCGTYVDEKSCLSERSMFDTSTTTCEWNLSDDGGGSCMWVEPTISYKVIVIISVLIAVLTAPINLVVDFLFEDILSAPTADENKVDSMVQSVGRRMSQVARRASNVVTTSVHAAVNSMGKAKTKKAWGLTRLKSSFVLDDTTRTLPPAVISSHALARGALGSSLKRLSSVGIIEDPERGESKVLSQSSTISLDAIVCSSKARRRKAKLARRYGTMPSHEIRSTSSVGPDVVANEKLDSVTFDQFLEDFHDQRAKLNGKYLRDFDDRWGWDAKAGRFRADRAWALPCTPSIESLVDLEIQNVSSICSEKSNKLRIATDVHTGLELLHLFVIDLLGRNSPAGRIFHTKTEEDFKHSFVVTKTAKILAWICVVFLNLFFAYFSILRGMSRTYGWQKGYCIACAIQFIIEVLFYETSECIWINYGIPQLVSADVERTITALTGTIDYAFSPVKRKLPLLDTPSYFFVSTRVAENFNDLFESSIVLAFHSYYPPSRMGRDWRENSSGNMLGLKRSRNRTRGGVMGFLGRVSVVAMLVTLLKYIGTINIRLQRVILHSIQPIIIAFVFVLLSNLQSNPWYGYLLLGIILFEVLRRMISNRTVTKSIPDGVSPLVGVPLEIESSENGSYQMKSGEEMPRRVVYNSSDENLSQQRSRLVSTDSSADIVRQRSWSFDLDSAVSRHRAGSYVSDSGDISVSDEEYNSKRHTGMSTAREELSARIRAGSFASSTGDEYDDAGINGSVENEGTRMRLTSITELDELYYPHSDNECAAKARGDTLDSEDISEERDKFSFDFSSSSSGVSFLGEVYSITSSSESSKEVVHGMMPRSLDCDSGDNHNDSSHNGSIRSRDQYSISSSSTNSDRYMTSSDGSGYHLSMYESSSSETDKVDALSS